MLDNLKKWYPVRQSLVSSLLKPQSLFVKAVDGVDLTLKKREILGLVGESGSGKSTLGELVVLLQPPSTGKILLDGVDIASLRGNELTSFRKRVQMIFQDPYATLNQRFTIYQSVVEPLVIHGIRGEEARRQRVCLALERSGLNPDDSLLNAFPHRLSGGQRQRVSIARAIVLEPGLVVADEPVSMLDVSIRSGILNLLSDLRRDLGLSLIFISHDLSTVQYLCDRIAIMYLGRMAEIGPTKQVINQACHPYTRALLGAVPMVDPDVKRERTEIESEPPSSIRLPPGCRFASRCPFVTPECNAGEPELVEIAPDHFVRCIHPRLEPVWY
ncbi:MAG: ABC transporter ATP-binding protein [Anaerolineales bacterium]|nr:ABC transporter ATP-binding protein [Anaerolineales bacterium]